MTAAQAGGQARAHAAGAGAPAALGAAVLRAVAHLPTGAAFGVAAALGRRRYRRARAAVAGRAHEILCDAMGVRTERAERLAELAFECAACDELGDVLLPRIGRDNLGSYLEIRGLEQLHAALDGGRGAILYSGHVRGNMLFFAALGLLGLRPNIVSMPVAADNTPVRRRAFDRRNAVLEQRMGCRFLFMGRGDFGLAARASIALRENGVVAFAIDHSHSGQTVDTEFLGRRARFPVGPLLVARAAGAPCLPFWLHRPPRRTPQVAEIGEPIEVSDDIEASLRQLVSPLETSIRRHPESWATWLFPDFRLFVEEA